ncbi:MAG: hypothetical protein R3D60_06070 [Paracoccaceae bacterium]
MRKFLSDESGAVTVDFVVLSAAIVGIGSVAVSAVSSGQARLAQGIRNSLNRAHVAGSDLLAATFTSRTGTVATSWGRLAVGSYDGWTAEGSDRNFELIPNGYGGVLNAGDRGMLDMGGSPGNLSISRPIVGAGAGDPVRIYVTAADIVGNNSVDVIYGGAVIGTINASRTMETYTFTAFGGMGDGSDTLTLSETGNRDNVGTYLGSVTVR